MKKSVKILNTKKAKVKCWVCSRCNINSFDNPENLIPCPRGSCEAKHDGYIVTIISRIKKVPTFMNIDFNFIHLGELDKVLTLSTKISEEMEEKQCSIEQSEHYQALTELEQDAFNKVVNACQAIADCFPEQPEG